jgi:hypothetical protein
MYGRVQLIVGFAQDSRSPKRWMPKSRRDTNHCS